MPQEFSHQNLRGRSFKGQDLAGANFSGADIRSTDFTGANLIGANFSHAKAGLEKRWGIYLVCISWLLSGVSELFSIFIGKLIIASILDRPRSENQMWDWVPLVILVVVIVVFIVVFRRGLNSAGALALASALALALAIVLVFGLMGTVVFASIGTLVGALAFTGTFAGTLAGGLAFALALAGAGAVGFVFALTGAGVVTFVIARALTSSGYLAFVLAFTLAEILLNTYIGWRAMEADGRYSLIRNIAVAFAAFGGTSFRNANLTNANFTAATLKSTDLRKAILTCTCFHKTKKLDQVRSGTSYLQKAQVVRVLITGYGQDLNFDREDLRGVNFQGANLADASFIGADLNQANLQDADLSRAKLVQAQLDGTDFTGATLTGAYIEDWGITSGTKFDGVRCEYVYMRLPTRENPDPFRKPDNRQEIFTDGEFGDFIKPIFDTLDLYHSQGVDPRAIAISFKQLAENHPEADLRIVGMEVRGENKFLLRAKTAVEADKSELSAEYFEIYNQLKALAQQELQALISEKDSRIRSLETMVVTALQSPKFYAQTYSNQGDTMSQSPNKQSNFDLKGAQFAGGLVNADTVTANQIGGNITNYSTEQKQNLAEAAAEIQQILNQLGQSYPTNTPIEKQIAVTEALKQIDSNPTLKVRVIGALKAGGTEALKELVDHPLVNILLATLERWQDVE